MKASFRWVFQQHFYNWSPSFLRQSPWLWHLNFSILEMYIIYLTFLTPAWQIRITIFKKFFFIRRWIFCVSGRSVLIQMEKIPIIFFILTIWLFHWSFWHISKRYNYNFLLFLLIIWLINFRLRRLESIVKLKLNLFHLETFRCIEFFLLDSADGNNVLLLKVALIHNNWEKYVFNHDFFWVQWGIDLGIKVTMDYPQNTTKFDFIQIPPRETSWENYLVII